ncbi:hypothetical protein [Salibacterium lacus]|uniref:Transposase IS701-like DDE domain-containing protein n=1 Tax=Salibacterium lacus TaxID=1898109 RepID=A0ABW5T429_9BACI
MSILAQSSSIDNFLDQINVSLHVSKPAYQHLSHLLQGMIQERRNGSMTVLRNSSFWQRHLPSITRFFQYGQWNEQGVQRKLQKSIYQQVQQMSSSEDPLMLIIDDSICPKTKPSSQAMEPTEGASYPFERKQGKPVYAHQWVTTMIGARDSYLPYAMTPYGKEEYSKLDMTRNHIDQIPDGTRDVYVLTGSWYASNP